LEKQLKLKRACGNDQLDPAAEKMWRYIGTSHSAFRCGLCCLPPASNLNVCYCFPQVISCLSSIISPSHDMSTSNNPEPTIPNVPSSPVAAKELYGFHFDRCLQDPINFRPQNGHHTIEIDESTETSELSITENAILEREISGWLHQVQPRIIFLHIFFISIVG